MSGILEGMDRDAVTGEEQASHDYHIMASKAGTGSKKDFDEDSPETCLIPKEQSLIRQKNDETTLLCLESSLACNVDCNDFILRSSSKFQSDDEKNGWRRRHIYKFLTRIIQIEKEIEVSVTRHLLYHA